MAERINEGLLLPTHTRLFFFPIVI